MEERFYVVPDHVYGPALVDRSSFSLVDNCPSVLSAQRLAAALNEITESRAAARWALPAYYDLTEQERERAYRYLSRLLWT
jgi:hypothetical protein